MRVARAALKSAPIFGVVSFFFAMVSMLTGAPGMKMGMWVSLALLFFAGFGGGLFFVFADEGHVAGITPPAPPPPPLEGVDVQCPHCGGTNHKQRGQVQQHCTWCGMSLVASGAVMQQSFEASRLDRLGETLRRLRMTRMLPQKHHRNESSIMLVVAPALFFVVPFAPSCLRGSWTIDGSPIPHVVSALAFLVYAGGVALAVGWRLRQMRRFRRRFEHLARLLRGRSHHGPHLFLDWLNHHWSHDEPAIAMSRWGSYGAVSGTVQGFPVAMELSTGTPDSRLVVLVSAFIPAADPVIPHVDPRWRAWGFEVTTLATGIRATASAHDGLAKGLFTGADSAPQLAAMVQAMVAHAQAWGGRPTRFAA